MPSLPCDCCSPFFANVLLECRGVSAICESPAAYCDPPHSWPAMPDWEDGFCYNAWSYLALVDHGLVVAANFAGEDGRIVPDFPLDNRKGEWRIAHQPSMTCYLRVWVRIYTNTFAAPTWDPPIVDSETFTDEVYLWEGTGNPCLPDTTKGLSDPENQIYSTPNVVGIPGARTTICAVILKYSYLAGYEPDISDPDNLQPNGFPDPTWEATPP